MRPIQLTLAGINSFLDTQTVSFEALLSRGLFGIFGPTGSGKSTLIDAMVLALYGQNSLPRNTKDFIHTEADSGSVKFSFSAGSGSERTIYTVERQFKRSNTGISTKLCRLTYEQNQELVVYDKTKEVDDALLSIIGLNQDQFLRTVVLPQGKFSEFIQLDPKDRRKMLEEIFRLEAFGDQLSNKIRVFKSEKDKELSVLKGKWETMEGVSEEAVQSMTLEHQSLEEQAALLGKRAQEALKSYENGKQLREWTMQWERLNQEKAAHELQKSEVEALRIKMDQHYKAEGFEAYYSEFEKSQSQHQQLLTEKSFAETQLKEYTNQAIALFGHLSELDQQLAAKWHGFMQQKSEKELDLNQLILSHSDKLKSLTEIEEQLQTMVFDSHRFEALTQAATISDEMLTLNAQLEGQCIQLSDCETVGKTHNEALQQQLMTVKAVEERLLKLENDQKLMVEDRENWLTQRGSVERRHQFVALMNEIQVGEPCPLCGQVTHQWDASERISTAKADAEAIESAWQAQNQELLKQQQTGINAIESLKQDLKSETQNQKNCEQALAETKASWKAIKQQIDQIKTQLQIKQETLSAIKERWHFTDAALGLSQMKEQQSVNESLQKERANRFKEYQLSGEQLAELQKGLTQISEELNGLSNKRVQIQSIMDPMGARFQFEAEGIIQPNMQISGNAKSLEALVEELKLLDVSHSKASERLSQCVGRIASVENQLKDLNETINKVAKDSGFEIGPSHRAMILKKDEVDRLVAIIQGYELQEVRLREQLNWVTEHLNGQLISEEAFNALVVTHELAQENVQSVSIRCATIQSELAKLMELLVIKTSLALTLESVEKEASKAALLAKLFKGGRFVEFVAMTELKYILKEASMRLMDMTGSRYSLEVDSKGNFMICDHYEGGVRRDLRSLSGGETFIAALCLALSMSSRVQHKGRTTLELFLLDEGFGTLDERLLDVVMSSLEKLHDEKVAVGLISHVEELKGRVPVKLEVSPAQSGIKGSTVRVSYN